MRLSPEVSLRQSAPAAMRVRSIPMVSSIFADCMTANFRREVFLVGPVKSPEALSRWINACAKSKDGPRRYISDHTLVKAAATE